MQPKTPSSTGRSGDVAFGIVVLASYVTYFSNGLHQQDPRRVLPLIFLGALYLTIGIVGSRILRLDSPRWLLVTYFSIQIALGAAMNLVSFGSMWLMLLPTVSQAIEVLPRPAGYTTALLGWLAQVVPIGIQMGWVAAMNWGVALLAANVFVVVFTQSLVNEQKARAELAGAHQKLREYAAQVEDLVTAQERNRLAREIHDGLGHYLTAVNIQIKAAQSVVEQNPALAQEALSNAQSLTQEALADVRRSISSLRADPATSRPLADTLHSLLLETRAAGIEAELEVSGEVRPLPPQIEFSLYRAAQEGLTNVRKHAHAAHVKVRLAYLPTLVRLTVEDDGVGAGQTEGGFGLLGLQERVQLVGGTLKIETAPGAGLTLTVELPA